MELMPCARNEHSCSLVAIGQEFAFPIDYSSGRHWEVTSLPSTVMSYSRELATTRLSACRKVAEILVEEQRLYHRELVNARRPDPHIYSVGNIVFAWHVMPREASLTNSNMHLLDRGVSPLP
jgi:hypothetical protein